MTRVIPVPDLPRSVFQVRMDGETYSLRVAWNDRLSSWQMDLLDDDGDAILIGRRMVLGFPLLDGVTDPRRPPGALFVIDPAGRQRTDPGRTAWQEDGENLRLIYIPADEIPA